MVKFCCRRYHVLSVHKKTLVQYATEHEAFTGRALFSFFVSCRFTSNDPCLGSRRNRMYLDPDVVPPLAGFRLFAVLGIFHHALSVPSVCIFNCSTVFDLFFITPSSLKLSIVLPNLAFCIKKGRKT